MKFMNIDAFTAYFADSAKEVIDPIVNAGRYDVPTTKIVKHHNYIYGQYGVSNDWGGLWGSYNITVHPKYVNLKCVLL